MTRYRVEWHRGIEEDVAQFLTVLPRDERGQLTDAHNQFEKELERDASSKGEPAHEGLWVFDFNSFRFIYELGEAQRR